MSTFNGPLQLSNIFKPKIWGRRIWLRSLRRPDPAGRADEEESNQRIGEVWVTDDLRAS